MISECPFVTVDTETDLDAALFDGRSINLRGEGSGGVITCLSPKTIIGKGSTISGNALLRFNVPPAGPVAGRALIIGADNVTLQGFGLTCTVPLSPTNHQFAISLDDSAASSHGTTLDHLRVWNWNRVVSKDGGTGSPPVRGVRAVDCNFHSFSGFGWCTGFGMDGLTIERCKVLGRLPGETHATGNAVTIGTNITNLVIRDSQFGLVDRMGLESTIADYNLALPPTSKNVGALLDNVQITDCQSFGCSLGHHKDATLRNVRVRNVRGIGIEFSAQKGDPSWGILDGCEVDNVAGLGLSIDKVQDVMIRNPRVSRVTANGNQWVGLQVYESERCSVIGGDFTDAGKQHLVFHRGTGGNATGRHVAMGNTFRRNTVIPNQRAIWCFDTRLTARQNNAYFPTAFEAQCNSGAGVWSETGVPWGVGMFGGSNLSFP